MPFGQPAWDVIKASGAELQTGCVVETLLGADKVTTRGNGGEMMGQQGPDRRAIVCGISADYAFALAALIAGVVRHCPDFQGDFVVFHDGLDAATQTRLRALSPRVVFRDFGDDVVTARLGADYGDYSPMIFAKFEMADMLADYDRCLWLDVDILVQGDFSDVWDFGALAWRPLTDGAFARRAAVMTAFADLRRDGVPLLNGGVVGMGPELRGRLCSADLYAMAARIVSAVGPHTVDELALYFAACAQGLAVTALDQRFNHPVVARDGRDAVMVHAVGPDKFWNAAPLQLAYPEWAQLARDWPYDGAQTLQGAATPDKALKVARNRAFWQGVYRGLRSQLPEGLQVDLAGDGADLRFFIKGLPDSTHLCLTRQATARRLGVALAFPDAKPLSDVVFARIDGLKIGKSPLEVAKTRKGWTYGTVVPLAM
jgi:hypothetical protein